MGFFSSIINPFKTISSSPGKALGLNDSYGALTDPIGFLTGENAAKAQNEQQLQFWNMQNAYNHPKEQMKRFAEAGLSPNLIYTQGNAGNAGAVGSAATGDAGSSVLSKASSVVAAIYGLKGLKADIANKQANNSLIDTQTEHLREQVRRARIDNDYLESHGLSTYSPTLARELESVPDSLLKHVSDFLYWFNRGRAGQRVDTVYDRGDRNVQY